MLVKSLAMRQLETEMPPPILSILLICGMISRFLIVNRVTKIKAGRNAVLPFKKDSEPAWVN